MQTMQKASLHSLPLKNIRIRDNHFNQYIDLVTRVILPYQWDILNDRVPDAPPSHCIDNFKITAGEMDGVRRGVVFQDSDVAKWLEAAAYSLETTPDPKLEKTVDEVIALIGRAQCEDGYINTYYTLVEPELRWQNLTEGHELYTAGHLMEAAVAYLHATGKRDFLEIMIRFADLICAVFGPNTDQMHGYPGHQEIELALVKMYRVTGKDAYLQTAKYFIDIRGRTPNYFLAEMEKSSRPLIFPEFRNYNPIYSQSHIPVREQKTAEGHAVRAVYMYCAMADLAEELGDAELLENCDILWDNIVNKRMYITGSIGSSGFLECFTADYDLPNDVNYSETCASIGLALFSLRMARIKKDAKYMDVAERALYNTLLSGISLDGERYFYVNPLEVWPDNCLSYTSKSHVKAVRQPWFDVACCPTNISRTLASLGQYIYMADEDSLYVNLYIQNEMTYPIAGTTADLSMATDFPRTGNIRLQLSLKTPTEFTLKLRIPDYAEEFSVSADGKPIDYVIKNGYACITQKWEISCTLEIAFPIRAKLVKSNPKVRANAHKSAIVRGPLVYCLEETDNFPNLRSALIRDDTVLHETFDQSLFGGTVVVTCSAMRTVDNGGLLYREIPPAFEPVTLKAIPYCHWCNRTPGEMLVWIDTIF